MVNRMKYKNYILGLGVCITVILTSLVISHVSSISAHKQLKPLQGVTIAIDAGHGGIDAGAQSGNIKESQINLTLAKKTKALLSAAGAKVILTRDDDYDLADKDAKPRKKQDMKRRMDILNGEDVDLFLSIHLNSYPSPNVKGAQAFYQKDNEVAKTFATIVQKHLKALTQTNMTSKPGEYYLLENAKKIGVLVECGFLSNPEDRENLTQDAYQEKVAKTLFESIKEYFNFLL